MKIKGKILEVLETWPLQLSIETDKGHRHVMLQADTRIIRKEELVDTSCLLPNLTVLIEIDEASEGTQKVQGIEILEN